MDPIGRLEHLNDRLVGDVSFEVLFAERLQTYVREVEKGRGGKKVERVFGWHLRVPVVDVAQQGVEGFLGGS